MSNSLLALGPFSFEGLESPEQIHFKTKQRVAVHHLGSGLSKIDYLGDDYETVSFRGIFSGTSAADRIRSIDCLRVRGVPLILSWSSKTLSVIITQFELDYSSDRWIPYRLSCYVIRSVNVGVEDPTDVMSASPATQVSDMLGLLEGTDMNSTSGQADAFLTLATLDFDTPPPEAIEQAHNLVGSIDDHLITLNNALRNDISANQTLPIGEATYMASLVTNYGRQVSLILSRSRAMSVITCAEEINQR